MFDGRPVWLASLSLWRKNGTIINADTWRHSLVQRAEDFLVQRLAGVGTSRHERVFRMYATFCIQRGLTDAEWQGLDAHFHAMPADQTARIRCR